MTPATEIGALIRERDQLDLDRERLAMGLRELEDYCEKQQDLSEHTRDELLFIVRETLHPGSCKREPWRVGR